MNSLAQFPPFPPMPVPAPIPVPAPMIGIAPAPIPVIVPPARIPVVVMPYRSSSSEVTYRRRRRHRPIYEYVSSREFLSSSSYSDSSYSSDFFTSLEFERRNGNSGRSKKYKRKALRSRRQVLTPVISYLTKDGRVAYHKKIKKENAGDWLKLKRKRQSTVMGGRHARGNERLKKKHDH